MILDLDDPDALDPARVGAKAAMLAGARRVGLPVLPGFVVDTSASLPHMEDGAAALPSRGSGGARLVVSSSRVPVSEHVVAAGADLAQSLVVRSSSPLEGRAEWAGAFASYLGVGPEDLPKAVAGCWASVFTVDSLARHDAMGVAPGSVGMAVLVQPEIEPAVSGVAELRRNGSVVVQAVAGSPVPLLRGWERGDTAQFSEEGWDGAAAIARVGEPALEEIRTLMGKARESLGATRCEWALSDRLWLLQLNTASRRRPPPPRLRSATSRDLIPTVQALMTAPGPLGRELVLPWALAGVPPLRPVAPKGDGDPLDRAVRIGRELTAHVWGMPADEAMAAAGDVLDRLRGSDPGSQLQVITRLRPPDEAEAAELMGLISQLAGVLVARRVLADSRSVWRLGVAELRASLDGTPAPIPGRIGVQSWEPLVADVVLDHGSLLVGTPAATGVGVGVRHRVIVAGEDRPPPRAVLTASQALPNLSQLLWDSAGLVTDLGSPAAHVFETARSLGVPAVCAVDPGPEDGLIIAVDGHAGVVATLPLVPGR